jgi:DNA-binding CsgD family transcriptional regulator
MTKRPNLTKEQKDFIAERREAGWSTNRIAIRLGVSPGSVAWHCLQMAVDPPNARPIDKTIKGPLVCSRNGMPVRRFTPEDDEKLLALSVAGKSNTEVARALNRRSNSIRGRLMTLARHEARAEMIAEAAANTPASADSAAALRLARQERHA